MPERGKVIAALECCKDIHQSGRWASGCISCGYSDKHMPDCFLSLADDAVELLKEQENLLGIHQTANSITFISTGTAQQGESRGISLGKLAMHEWLEKELLYRGLFNDDIRAVFDLAQNK